jgi:hypothetical protein
MTKLQSNTKDSTKAYEGEGLELPTSNIVCGRVEISFFLLPHSSESINSVSSPDRNTFVRNLQSHIRLSEF